MNEVQIFDVIKHLKCAELENDKYFFLRDFSIEELIKVYSLNELKAIARHLKKDVDSSIKFSKLNKQELSILIVEKFKSYDEEK